MKKFSRDLIETGRAIRAGTWFLVRRMVQVPWWISEVITDNVGRFTKTVKAKANLIAENLKKKIAAKLAGKSGKVS